MLEIKEHFTTVLRELEWENLEVAQCKHLCSLETLLKQFICLSDECDKFQVISLCSSRSSFSSNLFVCLNLVLVLVLSCLVSKKNCTNRWHSLFIVICRMLEGKEHLTTVLEVLEWGNIHVAHMEALIRNITKNLGPSDNCYHFKF